ncbi:hypothetical protein NL154_05640 [Rhizobium sp. YTUHZ044]|uniref:hypothetical protein n=1 Tax=Rhizobium sp. YTUHZ044 TaxID=2962678 RepID=UPI003DAA2EBB
MTDKPKVGLDRSKTGRAKGTPNKTTALLKDAILKAAAQAGDDFGSEGLVSYLQAQAKLNPGPFMSLLGKVLPMQVTSEDGGPVGVVFKTVYETRGD